ncbi:hypothetical protein SLS62_006434 [Diatrype stigma]|uniref:Extracellular membrane protein CFEM domain-containing protein n=1 Tax=Diatrype stigma TaxID=117547 RepID=A0AAN9YMT3_9PEZI
MKYSSCSFLSPLRPPLASSLLCINIIVTTVLGDGGSGAAVAVSNDFSSYPAGSQSCLDSSAQSSGCTSAPSGPDLNKCLCYNRGDFIYATARCVAAASPADLGAVYAQMRENCRGTGDTISVAEDSFMSQAQQATATKPAAAGPGGPTPGPLPPGDDGGGPGGATSLSMGAKIGIGAGIGFGVVVAALAAWFIWVYAHRQRLRAEEEGNSSNGKDPDATEMDNVSRPSVSAARAAGAAEYAQQNRQDGGAAELPTSSSASGSPAGWWNKPVAAEMGADPYYATNRQWSRQVSQASELESAVLAELPADYTGSELPATNTATLGSEAPAPMEVSPLSESAADQLPAAAVSPLVGSGGGGKGVGENYDNGASRVHDASGANDGGDSEDGEDNGARYGNDAIRSQAVATNSLMSSSIARGREDYSITSSSDTWSAWPSHDDSTTVNTALGPAPAGPMSPAYPLSGSRPGSSIHTQQAPRSRGSQLSS